MSDKSRQFAMVAIGAIEANREASTSVYRLKDQTEQSN